MCLVDCVIISALDL